MIVVKEITLATTIAELVDVLRGQLWEQGLFLLQDVKDSEHAIYVTCPVHAEGKEKNPSCGVAKHPVRTAEYEIEAGHVHCFRCGYTAPLTEFISFCFGKKDAGAQGLFWVRKHFANYSFESRGAFMKPFTSSRIKEKSAPAKESELLVAEYCTHKHPYMYKRKLDDYTILQFEVGYDKETDSLTFPVRDIKGNLVFVQRRAVKEKKFDNQHNSPKGQCVYGIHKAWKLSGPIYVCESIIDALTIWTYGKPAVALLGANATQAQIELLCRMNARHLILALDNDQAGAKASEFLYDQLKLYKWISVLQLPVGIKDVNELTREEFLTCELLTFR